MKRHIKCSVNYERGTFVRDGVKFSYSIYEDGRRYVQSHHPYDDAEYHWAMSRDGVTWRIYIQSPGKLVKTLTNTSDVELVADALLDLDAGTQARMVHW